MGWFKRKKASKNITPKTEATQRDSSIVRSQSITICHDAGFKPASSLPTIRETKLRPANEIAGRLHAIKALVLWLMVPTENLPDEKIINFINQNKLLDFMTEEEKEILNVSRNNIELRNSIGWKFENAWPLAWYFGYNEPEISGQMMTGEQMQEILINHTCSLDSLISEWLPNQHTLEEEKLVEKEDLFYCLHNAIRSAQLGGNTVPDGFDPIGNGGVIHERRHSLTWMLSNGTEWEDTDLST
ncbi:DUF4272 domain-containing protein [Tenacibaculum sp.]|uniref:DUF4272 domain-containing protein n=1 Tax=Tenacibaculum sp. TaxID=1906242 RepID=UPI003AA81B8A